MNICPKCNGVNGFTYNLVVKTKRSGAWGLDMDEEVEIERATFPKFVICIDCGKQIEFHAAHGSQPLKLNADYEH